MDRLAISGEGVLQNTDDIKSLHSSCYTPATSHHRQKALRLRSKKSTKSNVPQRLRRLTCAKLKPVMRQLSLRADVSNG